jgi:hypothetical protein
MIVDLLYECLQIIYSVIPKQVFLILLSGLILMLLLGREDKCQSVEKDQKLKNF